MSTNCDQHNENPERGRSLAVVIGGSIGGLLAARALADAYRQIIIVERDQVTDTDQFRRGVPQGRHGHALHPRGLAVIEDLFPGFTNSIVAAGAPLYPSRALRAHLNGYEMSRADTGARMLSTSRPFLERQIRRRVDALSNVSILDRCEVQGPLLDERTGCITGVRIDRRADAGPKENIEADLVVDATGRAGRSLRWLDELGFERPPVDELHVGIAYATQRVRLPESPFHGDRIVVVGPQPDRMTGMYLAQQEQAWWILTLFGYAGHEPPTNPRGFAAFASAVAPTDIAAVLDRAEGISEIFTHRLPSSLWRRYEQLRRFPSGFLVFGDAICSFNPIYGQGMTVATLQAAALRNELRRRRFDALRFFRAAAKPIGDAWDLATGSDLALPGVEGVRTVKTRLLNAYIDRVLRSAEHDESVSRAFQRVIGMLDRPPTLLRPPVAVRVIRDGLTDRRRVAGRARPVLLRR